MKRILVIVIGLMIPFLLFSQNEDYRTDKQKNLKPRKKLKIADKLADKGTYFNAIVYYEEVVNEKPECVYAMHQLAELNYALRDYKAAEKWYRQVLDTEPDKYPKDQFMYALMQKYNAKYDEAKTNFQLFIDEFNTGSDKGLMEERAEMEIEGCDLAKTQMASPIRVNIDHLEPDINNPFTEFAPKPASATELVYSSIRSDSALSVNDLQDENIDYYSKIYTAEFKNGSWQPSAAMPEPINSSETHSGNGTYSPDGKKFYFTRCKPGKLMQMECKIYVSTVTNGTFGEPVKLGETINLADHTSTHPSVSYTEDGKEVLYFTSNRPNGKGGLDIWYAESTGNNSFGEPINLGNTVNTMYDETTPYYDGVTGTLYFSSNGHVNIGGYDVYSVVGNKNAWEMPMNMGYPLNSSTDDLYFVLHEDGKNGYMVSNRPGVISIKSETCCDDIFDIKIIKEIFLKAYVATKNEPEVPVADADVSFFISRDGDLTPISTLKTNAEEVFIVPLDPDTKYKVNVTKAGFWGSENVVDLTGDIDVDTIERVFYINEIIRKKIKLERIYYSFDRYNISRTYKKSLDSLYLVLTENEDLILEIVGHTDSKGTDEYNIELAQKRAESAADYLMKKGISEDRLSLLAKGEEEPLVPNEKANGADDPKGRAKNRRVEFILKSTNENVELDIEYKDADPIGTY